MSVQSVRFPRQAAEFRPRLERLERRDCLSCTGFERAETLVILGDDEANQIEIAATRDEGPEESDEGPEARIVISCDGGEPERFTGVSQIALETRGGDDEITATFADTSAST